MQKMIHTTIMLLAAMAAGYLGGLMSQRLPNSFAQAPTPAVADVLRAKRIEVVDDNGKARVLLFAYDQLSGFMLNNNEGKLQVSLTLAKNSNPALLMCNATGKLRSYFRVIDDIPELSLCDGGDKLRGTFILNKEGASLNLFDNAGVCRTTFGACSLITEQTGVVTQRPESSLVFFDKNNNVLMKLPQ